MTFLLADASCRLTALRTASRMSGISASFRLAGTLRTLLTYRLCLKTPLCRCSSVRSLHLRSGTSLLIYVHDSRRPPVLEEGFRLAALAPCLALLLPLLCCTPHLHHPHLFCEDDMAGTHREFAYPRPSTPGPTIKRRMTIRFSTSSS